MVIFKLNWYKPNGRFFKSVWKYFFPKVLLKKASFWLFILYDSVLYFWQPFCFLAIFKKTRLIFLIFLKKFFVIENLEKFPGKEHYSSGHKLIWTDFRSFYVKIAKNLMYFKVSHVLTYNLLKILVYYEPVSRKVKNGLNRT